MSETRSTGRRTGRRPGPDSTRPQVLEAARELFGAQGYEGTTLRAVAARAGVDPALVVRFFGGKEGLFAAVLELAAPVPSAMAQVLAARDAAAGERVVRTYLGLWDDARIAATMRSLMRAAIGSDRAAEMLRDFITGKALGAGITSGERSDAQLRFTLVASQLVGMAAARYVLRAEPMASLDTEDIVRLYEPTVQRYLVDDLGVGPPSQLRGE